MSHTAIPEDELRVFNSLKGIGVVFDIGARDDVDYLILKPEIELHAFEPNPEYFEELRAQIGDRKNVFLNQCGVSDKTDKLFYNHGGESLAQPDPNGVPVIRLRDYINRRGITQIDFLKTDTEGHELRVIRGLGNKIKICRYIQYETNSNSDDKTVEDILRENGFKTYYTGYRNQIAVRDGEEMPWIPNEVQEGGLREKTEANRL